MSLTSLVGLEAALLGVDTHGHWTHFVERDSQCMLVADRYLLKALALGSHA